MLSKSRFNENQPVYLLHITVIGKQWRKILIIGSAISKLVAKVYPEGIMKTIH